MVKLHVNFPLLLEVYIFIAPGEVIFTGNETNKVPTIVHKIY